jgi:transmembrane sensor
MEINSLRYLLEKRAKGPLQDNEQEQLYESLTNIDNEQLLNNVVQLITEQENIAVTGLNEEEKLAIFNKVIKVDKETVQQKPVVIARKVHFWKTAWFKYAAAILLILTGAFIYYQFSKTSASLTEVAQTTPNNGIGIDPGTTKAILTLSDGSQVELNKASSETIADGNLSIKNKSGQLIYSKGGAVTYNTMSTPNGGHYQLTLHDGTRIWLNAASSITYPTAFTGKTREVKITGEVYFEVKTNKSQPFIVKTIKEQIAVLGTSFNVNAYEDELGVKASLIEGIIKVADTNIKPGQAYQNGKVKQTNIAQDMAWKQGIFDFHKMPLTTALRQLGRWYDVKIVYTSKPDIILGGTLGRDLPFQQVLDMLSKMGVKYTLKNKVLDIQ